MLSHLKAAVKWAFQADRGHALIRLLEGVLSTAALATMNGGQELGLAPAFRWVGAVLFLVLLLALSLGLDGLKRPIWNNSGWGWYPAGLMVGGALLWPVRFLWGAPANGYTGSEQLPLIAHMLFWGGVSILALGVYLIARRETDSPSES